MCSSDLFALLVFGFIPLTWMLLAPLWTKAAHPIRQTLVVYGLLRWFNTVVGWVIGIMFLSQPPTNNLATLAGSLIVFGTLILCANVAHFASSLSGFQTKQTLTIKNP